MTLRSACPLYVNGTQLATQNTPNLNNEQVEELEETFVTRDVTTTNTLSAENTHVYNTGARMTLTH
jgi:hypothetical protein